MERLINIYGYGSSYGGYNDFTDVQKERLRSYDYYLRGARNYFRYGVLEEENRVMVEDFKDKSKTAECLESEGVAEYKELVEFIKAEKEGKGYFVNFEGDYLPFRYEGGEMLMTDLKLHYMRNEYEGEEGEDKVNGKVRELLKVLTEEEGETGWEEDDYEHNCYLLSKVGKVVGIDRDEWVTDAGRYHEEFVRIFVEDGVRYKLHGDKNVKQPKLKTGKYGTVGRIVFGEISGIMEVSDAVVGLIELTDEEVERTVDEVNIRRG